MNFPKINEERRLQMLTPHKGKIRAVLDTDTYNEIDDQFALAHAVLSKDSIDLSAVYAAPFFNSRSNDAGIGMEKSYEEIQRILGLLNVKDTGFAFRGSASFMKSANEPVDSEAARDLVKKAGDSNVGPLYVLTIGAPTNVASAILMAPEIIEKIVVVWLGGQAHYWPSAREFNLLQDMHASRILFDCGVPLVQIPCAPVTSHLLTSVPEMDFYLKGKGKLADYLAKTFREYRNDQNFRSKEIWDISVTAYAVNPEWVPSVIVHSPILTDQQTYSHNTSRHFMRCARTINRDAVFKDMLTKIIEFKG